MVDSYNLVASTWQLLDAAANVIDIFYLPDTYVEEPAGGATLGVLLSEDNGLHRRFISNAEIVAMGLTNIATLTSTFDTDKATVASADTNMMNGNRVGTAVRAHTTNSNWGLTKGDSAFGINAAGSFMQAVSGDLVVIGDIDDDVNSTIVQVDDSNEEVTIGVVGNGNINIVVDSSAGSNSFTGESQYYKDNSEGGTAAERYISKLVTDSSLGSGATAVITLAIPDEAIIQNIQLNNDAAVTTSGGDNTYDAAFSGGDTTAIDTGILGAINTKTDKQFVPILTTGTTELTLTAGNSENFAGGTVQVLVRYKVLVSMADV